MTMIKNVDGVDQEMTADEIAELEANWPTVPTLPSSLDRRQYFTALASPPYAVISLADALAAIKNNTVPPALQTLMDAAAGGTFSLDGASLDTGTSEVNVLKTALEWSTEKAEAFLRFAATL